MAADGVSFQLRPRPINEVNSVIDPLNRLSRVALYSRVSTKDKGQETENQLRQLREFCTVQGWPVVEEYSDHASGAKSNRESFRQMMDDASRRKFDMVLFWSLDRFSREGALQTLQYLQMLNSHGVHYRSYTEQYLDSCGIFREAVISILAVIAKQERVRIQERVTAGLARARARGQKFGRPAKVFDKQAVYDLKQQGKSLRQIATQLRMSKSLVERTLNTYKPLKHA